MKHITKENVNEISNNKNVIDYVNECLDKGFVLVAVSDRSVGKFVCSCDLGQVQRIESRTYTKPKAIQFEAQAHGKFQTAEDSFQRCDTDGGLSQWASGLTGQLLLAQADIAEEGGYSWFPCLYDDVENKEINAKLVDGKYGKVWAVDDEDTHFFNGRKFIPFAGYCTHCGDPDHQYKQGTHKGLCKKCNGSGRNKSRIQKQWGLIEKGVRKPAHAIIKGEGKGLSGNVWVEIIEVEEVYAIYAS